MLMMSRSVCTFVTLIIALSFFTGCGRMTPVEQANKKGILLKANGTDPTDLDPQVVTGVTEFNIVMALMEGLMIPDAKTLEPMPGIAESYDVSEDGRTYTFYLRPDARWSNGDAITAHDFVFSYRRMLSPSFGAEYAYMLYPMLNAKAYHSGELDDPKQLGVEALDVKTLVIRLENPVPFFLALTSHF